jgi:hypothetical protein
MLHSRAGCGSLDISIRLHRCGLGASDYLQYQMLLHRAVETGTRKSN